MPTALPREITHDLANPGRLIPALSSGLVVGLLILAVEVSLASLIFSGLLAGLAAAADPNPRMGFFTICVAIAILTLATGVLFLLMARFGLGRPVRLLPPLGSIGRNRSRADVRSRPREMVRDQADRALCSANVPRAGLRPTLRLVVRDQADRALCSANVPRAGLRPTLLLDFAAQSAPPA